MHRTRFAKLLVTDEELHCSELENLTKRMVCAKKWPAGDRRQVELRIIQLRVDELRASHDVLEKVILRVGKTTPPNRTTDSAVILEKRG